MEHLSPQQRTEIEELGLFHVVGSATGRRYAIRLKYVANIDEYGDDNRHERTWCFLPEGNLPLGDVLLSQKLALEMFEHEALSIAILWRTEPQRLPS